MAAKWENYYGTFEDLIQDHVFAPHPLEGEGTRLVEFYDGDHKNPPHAILECFTRNAALIWEEVLSDWGCFAEAQGTELYVEPYALI